MRLGQPLSGRSPGEHGEGYLMPPVSGADSLEVRRAYLRKGRWHQGHDRRLVARWIVLAVAVLWLLVAGVVLVAAG
jgi:hypothetical protein